jgi:uncharacterized damage-inducible protein DinB
MNFFTCVLASLSVAATAFASEPAAPPIAKVFDGQLSGAEHDAVSLAEAMPADKYNFAPKDGEFKGVRTFAQQMKHIAAVNFEVAAVVVGEKLPAEPGGENGPDSVQTKDQVVKYLKDSFALAHKAIATLNDHNLTELFKSPWGNDKVTRVYLATVPAWHTFDHYGQAVVYARMNGVVPPASK